MKKTANKKLKIALVSDAIYPYNKGGKEKRVYEFSTRLAKSGHSVHLYTMKWWEQNTNHKIENKVHLHAISNLYPLYSGQRRSIQQALLFALSCFKLLQEDFDLIDVDHMPHLILFPLRIVTLLKRKKMYVTWNEVWGRKYWIEYLGILGNIAYIVELLSVRMADEIIAVSQHTKEKLINDLGVKQPITVVPNGINLDEITRVRPAKEKSDIIFAGRLLSHKNVDVLLKAVADLKKKNPSIQAFIVGNGPEKPNLQKLAKKLRIGKNVRFFDFLEDHRYLYALMKASRVFVFPSTREGFGIVALEANASGIPVITTTHKNNATKDLITPGENGHAISLHTDMFKKTINSYLNSKQERTLYRNFVKQYDWNSLATRVEEVYL